MNLDKSSFVGQQSQLSLFVSNGKQQSQQKYQELFKQASQYRLQLRQLRQDNQWLKTNNEGLQNQCTVLKELLRQKKDMIVQINTELRFANEEINRLEDQLSDKNQSIKTLQRQLLQKQAHIQKKNQFIIRLQCQLQSKNVQFQSILKQKQSVKAEFQNKEKIYMQQMQQKVISILNKCQKSQSQSQNNRNSTSNSHSLSPSSLDKYYNMSMQQSSFHSKSNNTSININNKQSILNNLVAKMQSLIEKQNTIKIDYELKLTQKSNEISKITKNTQMLQYQLKQAADLVQQYEQKIKNEAKRTKLLQQKIQQTQKQSRKQIQECQSLYHLSIQKIVDLLSPLMRDQQQSLTRLVELTKKNKNHYQINIILQQLKLMINGYVGNSHEKTKLKKQAKEMQNKLKIMEQEYDILKLKFISLQRQFQAVVDDNKRILKFNQLSRFRTDRNMRTNNHSYHDNSNKENSFNSSNIAEFVSKK